MKTSIDQGGFRKIYKGTLMRSGELIDIRLQICVNIARALCYIHYDVERDFSVIHRNIKTSKILLDDKDQPKLAGFEHFNDDCCISKDHYASSRMLVVALAIINKQDIKLAQLAKSHYEEKQLDDLIDPHLRKQMDQESFNIFAETAYYYLKEQRAERPSIDEVYTRLMETLHLQWKHEELYREPSIAAKASDRWK
ncbi:kinase-like domain, phloem protein 2-like protein, partial [Tanacetum coccineum]